MSGDFRGIIVKNLILLGLICVSLGACSTYDDINFEAMNEGELLQYNRGRPLGQMIVCSDEQQRTMSRVRRRRCATVEQMYGSVEQAEKLGVLHVPQG